MPSAGSLRPAPRPEANPPSDRSTRSREWATSRKRREEKDEEEEDEHEGEDQDTHWYDCKQAFRMKLGALSKHQTHNLVKHQTHNREASDT